jgi:pyruvate dehydrogenase E1 component alpha subunit
MTRDTLIAFSARVRTAFLAKQIRSPVHLCSDTQAQPLIEIFKSIRPQDYVFATWRNMFHALLKGIPEDELFAQILEGRSMYISSKAHNFMSGSIVGGMLPIAAGVAAGLKRKVSDARVHVFVGDMAASAGLFHEFEQYCQGHRLPVQVIVESNGLSTDTPTAAAWGNSIRSLRIDWYHYDRTTPHVGVGEHVSF